MGSGNSKRSNTLPPVRAHQPLSLPPRAFTPTLVTADRGTDPPHIQAQNAYFGTRTLPACLHPKKDEEASILLDDNAPIPVLFGEGRPESGTGLFALDSARLNGQWTYIPGDCEIEMEDIMNVCVEKAFVRGLPAASFRFEGNPCRVTFNDMSFALNVEGATFMYPVSRRPRQKERLFWQANDQLMRPFIPDAEALILSHKDAEVVFQMDNDVLNVNFDEGVVVDVNTGVKRLIQLLEDDC